MYVNKRVELAQRGIALYKIYVLFIYYYYWGEKEHVYVPLPHRADHTVLNWTEPSNKSNANETDDPADTAHAESPC